MPIEPTIVTCTTTAKKSRTAAFSAAKGIRVPWTSARC
jgi:hypothetical protein